MPIPILRSCVSAPDGSTSMRFQSEAISLHISLKRLWASMENSSSLGSLKPGSAHHLLHGRRSTINKSFMLLPRMRSRVRSLHFAPVMAVRRSGLLAHSMGSPYSEILELRAHFFRFSVQVVLFRRNCNHSPVKSRSYKQEISMLSLLPQIILQRVRLCTIGI